MKMRTEIRLVFQTHFQKKKKCTKLTRLHFMVGGSLMVQMFGSLPINKPIEVEEANQKGNLLLVPEKQKVQSALSTSPVVVRTKKDVIDLL